MNNFEHIYIHWPFCNSKCYYCDFLSFCNKTNQDKEYHDVLCSQLKYFKDNKSKIKTIYIGGGTPSIYPLDLLKELFENLNKNFDLSDVKEITIEANPADITKDKLEAWKSFGINRLSMGIQILSDEILAKIGRRQTTADAIGAINLAEKYFDNISVDLILGLPDVTDEIWQNSLKTVVSWPVKHISVYILTLYNKTKLYDLVKRNEISLQKDDTIISHYIKTVEFLEKNDFMQYEISNFSKVGFESIHNMAYWDRKPYLGLGLGASSFDGTARYINETNLNKFLNINLNPLNCAQKEILTDRQVFIEKLMLDLRKKNGGDLHSMLYFLKSADKIKFLNSIEELKKQGLILQIGGKVSLTQKGLLLENEVVLKLI
ncbi:radical SAM family heme chaperone HemW [Candidatus Dependentiae bacterium]|nr:radical SAM family heme chaperone HemW [Candidatus Dependentiae bacterium]MBU4386971.1 radical SAM family heme chaperone HemW [Candidatus Dependentiae bacterium]MCG2755961.1 radical SAM family heme chaperone HemW [Candidatus Dependentiae bacterium]